MKYATLRGKTEDCVFNNQGQFKLRYSRRHEITALAGFLALCLGGELAGSVLAAPGLWGWYLAANAPPLSPPSILFFPAWTILALCSGIAAWEIWREPDVGLRNHAALRLWGWQLGLNAVFTPLLFGLHWFLPAAGLGVALLVSLGLTIRRFARLNRLAAALMLPLACWVGFELYLNAGFWWLNT